MAVHVVRRGDTLSAIARQYGVRSWQELYNDPSNAAFRLRRPNPDLIYPGDEINVPGAAQAAASLIYQVPNLQLIPQDLTMACWYASAQMLIQWRRNSRQMTESGLRDPSEVPSYIQMYLANDGIPWAQIHQFAQDLGLVPLPLMSPTPQTVLGWLQRYGPIWADGMKFVTQNGQEVSYGHVVVIGGISLNPDRILILDPEHGGRRAWHPLSHLGSILSDGANPNRNQFLLRLP